jgi:hypothetical protein
MDDAVDKANILVGIQRFFGSRFLVERSHVKREKTRRYTITKILSFRPGCEQLTYIVSCWRPPQAVLQVDPATHTFNDCANSNRVYSRMTAVARSQPEALEFLTVTQ